MKCWICGDEGTTGEHLTKASDLRALFGEVTQKRPIFLHTDQQRNKKISSIKKSNSLKSAASICPQCNNARTADHDRAWEKLSKFLRERHPPIKKGDVLRLDSVFPGSVARSMLNVHLFFVKLFGCIIVEYDVLIDIEPFAEAILHQKPHREVYIAFGPASGMETGRSNMEMANLNGKCVYATWFYIVDQVLVNVMYAEQNERRQGLVHAWHPSNISKHLHIGAY